MKSWLDDYFRIAERGTSVRTEILGGATTFVTMAYIIVVNPAILALAGLPLGPSTVATILTAAFGCFAMGLYANLPIAVAPYMGENAFIAFSLVALNATWQQRLGAVFVSGVVFFFVTVVGIRGWLANSISASMKFAIVSGIGLFLTIIGLYQTGIVTSFVEGMPPTILADPTTALLRAPDVPLKIGNFHDPRVLLAVIGIVTIVVLLQRRVRGAILIGIALVGVLGALMGYASAPTAIVALPIGDQYDLFAVAFQLDIPGVLQLAFLPTLLTLFLMSFLDTLGSLVGLGAASGLEDSEGNLPDVKRPMIVDALSCMFSGLVGTSTSGAYIESATGIQEGARTGLAAIATGILFLGALFLLPLVEPLQALKFAYCPALVAVGVLMMKTIGKVDFEDLTEALPAFATIAMMAFTYNIANGITAGLILYVVVKVLAGRWRDLNSGSIVFALVSAVYYVFGLPH